jgi:hypothetical protein
MVSGGSANPEGMGRYSWVAGLFGGFRSSRRAEAQLAGAVSNGQASSKASGSRVDHFR